MIQRVYTVVGHLDKHKVIGWYVTTVEKTGMRVQRRTDRAKVKQFCDFDDEGQLWYRTWDEAQKRAGELNEEYALKGGQVRCAYCHHPTDNPIHRTIYSRQYDGGSKSMKFCSRKCAANMQMAHE